MITYRATIKRFRGVAKYYYILFYEPNAISRVPKVYYVAAENIITLQYVILLLKPTQIKQNPHFFSAMKTKGVHSYPMQYGRKYSIMRRTANSVVYTACGSL